MLARATLTRVKWKPLADVDVTGATVYRHARDVTAGVWYLMPDGEVVHETVDGNRQTSMHTAEALADPTRFTPA